MVPAALKLVGLLTRLGWLTEGTAGLAEAIKKYQRFHGLKPTGRPNPATIRQLEAPRCGLPDVMAVSAGVSRWATPTVLCLDAIAFPWADPARVHANYAEARRRISAVCGLTLAEAETPGTANITATAQAIDGPGNVLALSQLPPADAPVGYRLWQHYDPTEKALLQSDEIMIAMMTHELGHACGLGHLQAGNLMAPVLSPKVTTLQPGDVAELVARYGPRAADPPGSTPPTPWGDPDGTVTFRCGRQTIEGRPFDAFFILRPAK